MKVVVEGIRKVSFTTKDGEAVSFNELHYSYISPDVTGRTVATVNTKLSIDGIMPKTEVNLDFMPDKTGKAKLTGITK